MFLFMKHKTYLIFEHLLLYNYFNILNILEQYLYVILQRS